MIKPQISIDDFAKIDIRVGTIVECEELAESEKLLKLTVDFGKELGTRTIMSGIKKWYNASSLLKKQGVFIINLPVRQMLGKYESQGMILVAMDNDKLTILKPGKKIAAGSEIK